MTQLSKHHKTGTPWGQGKCSLLMQDGYCNALAYGPHKVPCRDCGRDASKLFCQIHGGVSLQQALGCPIVIRFDGPPGPQAGRFVEAERDGASIKLGGWVQDGDDWLLVLPSSVTVKGE